MFSDCWLIPEVKHSDLYIRESEPFPPLPFDPANRWADERHL